MATTLTPSETVMLMPGMVVSLDALRLLWRLEDRRCIVRLDGDQLLIGPRHQLTADDRDGIRQHRDQLIALVRHVEVIQ